MNKSADKRYLAGSEISPFTKQNHSQNDCGLRKMFESDVEAEQNNIAVLHHILLALGTDKALFTGSGQRAELDEVLVVDDLGTDEAELEVGVDLAGSLRRLCACLLYTSYTGMRADLLAQNLT